MNIRKNEKFKFIITRNVYTMKYENCEYVFQKFGLRSVTNKHIYIRGYKGLSSSLQTVEATIELNKDLEHENINKK